MTPIVLLIISMLQGVKGEDWQTVMTMIRKGRLDKYQYSSGTLHCFILYQGTKRCDFSNKHHKKEGQIMSLCVIQGEVFCVLIQTYVLFFNRPALETGAAAKLHHFTMMAHPLPVTERWAWCQLMMDICLIFLYSNRSLQRCFILSPPHFLIFNTV